MFKKNTPKLILLAATLLACRLQAASLFGLSSLASTTASVGSYKLHTSKQESTHTNHREKLKTTLPEKAVAADAPVEILMLHGFGGSSEQADYYKQSGRMPNTVTYHAPDFDCSTKYCDMPLKKACFAQDNDIATVRNAYLAVNAKNKFVIIKGVSNGAASAITFAGSYNLQNAQALVVESPYADVENVISNIIGSTIIGKVAAASASALSNYSPYGIRPIDVVHKIQKDIPVLFICSHEDKLIPAAQTIKLYEALKAAGHTKAHLVVLNKGEHANLLWGQEGNIYLAAEHAFYKKYGLPHNPKIAQCYDLDKQQFIVPSKL